MKNNDKDVAVIVVNYNGLEDSINCIESLYSIRDSEKITIVLVDNASRRNEADIIAEKFPAAIVIKNNSNGGFSAGNNIGIEYALSNQYKYIMLLNNDTVVEEGIITKLMSHCTDVSVAVPKILYYSSCKTIWYGGGTINKITGNAEHENMGRSDNENDTKVRKCTFATGCCMMIQSDVLKKVGKLDENFFMYCEDTEFCIRLSLNGVDINYVPEARLRHKVSSSTGGMGSAFSIYYMTRNRLNYIKKYKSFFYFTAYPFTLVTRYIRMFACRDHEKKKAFRKGINDHLRGINGKVEL